MQKTIQIQLHLQPAEWYTFQLESWYIIKLVDTDTGIYLITLKKFERLEFPLNVLKNNRALVTDSDFTMVQNEISPINVDSTFQPQEVPLIKMEEKYPAFLIDSMRAILLIWLMATSLIVGWLLFRRKISKAKLNEGPPLFLFPPELDMFIKPSNSLWVWSQKLVQREQSDQKKIDIVKSIRNSAKSGGMPSLLYEQLSISSTYIFLLDISNPDSQQLRLCQYLSRFLMVQEVSLEIFYFSGSPQNCWNEKFSRGILLEDLAVKTAGAHMVIFSRLENLVDIAIGSPQKWLLHAGQFWGNKAVFTFKDPSVWNWAEFALCEWAHLLPVQPDGYLKMAEYFATGALPSKKAFNDFVSKDERYNHLFRDSPELLTKSTIANYFNSIVEQSISEILFQWACATLLYTGSSWEVTLAIGRSFDKEFQPGKLLTSSNLIGLVGMPWLRGVNITQELRRQLINELSESSKMVALKSIDDLLHEPIFSSLSKKSVAYQERKVRLAEIHLHSSHKSTKKKSIKTLLPFIGTGMINDPVVLIILKEKLEKRRNLRAISFLAILITASFFSWLCVHKYMPLPNAWLSAQLKTDSGAYFNNLACMEFNKDAMFKNDSSYSKVMRLLNSSRKFSARFQQRFNYLSARYDRGVSMIFRGEKSARGNFTAAECKIIDLLTQPLESFSKGFVPNENTLDEYIKMVAYDSSALSLYNYIEKYINKNFAQEKKIYLRYYGAYYKKILDTISIAQSKLSHLLSQENPAEAQLFESFKRALGVSLIDQDSIYRVYTKLILLYKNGPKKPNFIIDSLNSAIRVPVSNSDQIQLEKELAMSAITRLTRNPLLGISYDDTLARFGILFDKGSYTSLARAIECKNLSEPIYYFWIPLSKTMDSTFYFKELDSLFYTDKNNYLIYFFQFRRLIRVELRVQLNPIQYASLLKKERINPSILNQDNEFFYDRGDNFFAITRPPNYYTKFIIGLSKTSTLCSADWWHDSTSQKLFR